MAILSTTTLESKADCQIYEVSFSSYPIYTTVTSNPTRVSDWIYDVRSDYPLDCLIVGLGAEWCPEPVPGEQSPIAVIHLCVGDRCLIYQILHSPHIPSCLSDFLSADFNTFVGVGVKDDLARLHKEYGIGGHAQWEELGELAASASGMDRYKREELRSLASCVLDIEMEKPVWVRRSWSENRLVRLESWWDNRFLSLEQVKYACVQSFISFQIGTALINDSRYY